MERTMHKGDVDREGDQTVGNKDGETDRDRWEEGDVTSRKSLSGRVDTGHCSARGTPRRPRTS